MRKWRHIVSVPMTVLWEVGIGMMEGAMKYGRHNYRATGVRASVYVDAAMGHIGQWWEGEDTDADSGLSHITKAICSLIVLRDAMIQDMLIDDRPPRGNLDKVRSDLQKAVDALFEKYPDDVVKPPFTRASEDTVVVRGSLLDEEIHKIIMSGLRQSTKLNPIISYGLKE